MMPAIIDLGVRPGDLVAFENPIDDRGLHIVIFEDHAIKLFDVLKAMGYNIRTSEKIVVCQRLKDEKLDWFKRTHFLILSRCKSETDATSL